MVCQMSGSNPISPWDFSQPFELIFLGRVSKSFLKFMSTLTLRTEICTAQFAFLIVTCFQ